jgi:hypothetical protein
VTKDVSLPPVTELSLSLCPLSVELITISYQNAPTLSSIKKALKPERPVGQIFVDLITHLLVNNTVHGGGAI